MKLRKSLLSLMAFILTVCLVFGGPLTAFAGENDMISEVRELLENQYVEQVSDEVLSQPTIKDMLAKLDDPHTQYMAKAEYDQFLSSLDRAFSGIGIELEMVEQGVLVTRLIDGFGAEKAGLKAGDIITEAGGYSLAGKTSEYCVSVLRGEEGSKVQVKVNRAGQTLNFTIERMVITLPLADSAVVDDHIGYIAIYSFGKETVAQFEQHARALKEKGVDSWIIDLRNNGGGYTQAALELLGYFIEDKSAVILKDRSILQIVYRATKQEFTLEGPIVFLTNGYTASSSEIVTAAVKDHHKATIIGDTTIGSGRVKALMPLSNGDYLKMTVNKFLSPNGNPIDEVGIAPHIKLSGVDALQTAAMMLNSSGSDAALREDGDKSGYIQLNTGSNGFAISLEELRNPEYWQIGKELLDSAYVTTTLKLGGVNGWEAFPEETLKNRYQLYYPGYIQAGNLPGIPLDKTFTITFNQDMDWQSVEKDSIELINTDTGERVECKFSYPNQQKMTVTPQTKLSAGTDYWLVIHPTIQDARGQRITGGVALASTVK